MAAEDYHDMGQMDDFDFITQNHDDGGFCYLDHRTGEHDHMNAHIRTSRCERKDKMAANRGASRTQQKQTRADKITRNKFYVGAESALDRNWGHPTLPKAIAHAEELMNEQDRDEMFVVQIIRVVRRRKMPVEVERV